MFGADSFSIKTQLCPIGVTPFLVITLVVLGAASQAVAQLPAFPGAEGVAKHITGGRGGDVYKVTNLNDSGVGSLRYGIQNAPSAGRTVVFDVAGTIHLQSSLDFNGKDNITVAGQTAPGGGITLSGHRLRINSLKQSGNVVDPLNNVVVQFLRVRPGEAIDNADGVWVETGNNVIVDHVTTSWSTDESLSVTHDSDNVTVQWSTITQGLLNHSYGSLLNGGAYTYAYNLYAHNRSRNPRLQQSNDLVMELDFANNVIYNPGDRFAYGGDEYSVNFVGNYGVRGPNTGDTNHAFARDTDSESKFYVEGNIMDNNTNGLLDGVVPVLEGDDHQAAMFREGADYTLLASRVNIPPVSNQLTAQQAYVQVLSRAGVTNYRDTHDRDMIRDVINQQPGHIESESEWGSLPTLPGGSAAADSNNDGVPDAWAMANYGDSSTPLNATYATSGYTYLEEFLHSLTPYAYAPSGTQAHTITTGYGQGGDAQANENGGASAISSGDGTGDVLTAAWAGASGATNQAIVLRFDLSEIAPGTVTDAVLELTAAEAISGQHDFKVWGLEHDDADWNWDESTLEFSNAPGLAFDGDSRTLGIDPRYTADGEPAEKDNFPLDTPGLYSLGEFSISAMAEGQTASFDGLNLAVMLNLAAYLEGEDQAGLVTLILQQTSVGGAAAFFSHEGDALLAPRLAVDAVVNDLASLPGDYNSDGTVDAADYSIWRDNLGAPAESLPNDIDGGAIGAAQYATWRANYGTSLASSVTLPATEAPEPASLLVMLIGLGPLACRPHTHRCSARQC